MNNFTNCQKYESSHYCRKSCSTSSKNTCSELNWRKGAEKLNSVSLSNDTVRRRIHDMSDDISDEVTTSVRASKYGFAMQLDESTDVTNSQSIADSFHQSKPGARTVLATVDLAKAFDSVWHSALLSKLLSLDLPLCFVEWIQSYLSDRRSKVRICNSYSRPFRLRRGVPQGSVLGPVLFSLYINELPTFLPASVKTSLYADDLAIWASSPSVECATAVVQAALNRLVKWSSKWRLPLNPLKCETSFFSLDPTNHVYNPLCTFLTPLSNSTLIQSFSV